MTLDEIEAFVAIAEKGGVTRAAQHLGRTQPAITRRIRQIEAKLKAPLVQSSGRGVRLTEQGLAFLPHAQTVLAALKDGERAVGDISAGGKPSSSLSLAIVGTLADSHVVNALRVFEEQHKDVSVELRTANSDEVSFLVKRGNAEIGLRYFEDQEPGLESLRLGEEKIYVVVGRSHPVKAKRLKDLARFEEENWLSFPPEKNQVDSFGHLLERELKATGLAHPKITIIDSLTAQKRLIEAGYGIGLMPMASCREEIRIGSLRKIDVSGMNARLPVVAVRRKKAYRTKQAEAFLKLLSRYTPELRR